MNEQIARKVSARLNRINTQLGEVVYLIHENCGKREYKRYQKELNKIIGALYINVSSPIFKEHPHLIPKDLRD